MKALVEVELLNTTMTRAMITGDLLPNKEEMITIELMMTIIDLPAITDQDLALDKEALPDTTTTIIMVVTEAVWAWVVIQAIEEASEAVIAEEWAVLPEEETVVEWAVLLEEALVVMALADLKVETMAPAGLVLLEETDTDESKLLCIYSFQSSSSFLLQFSLFKL